MQSRFYPAWSYFNFWLLRSDQYSVQSPFVFELYNGLIGYCQENKNNFSDILALRKGLLADNAVLEVEDLGAGSKRVPGKKRKVKDIARYSTSHPRFCLLYQFFCSKTPANAVLELGTCLGINARFLSKVTQGKVYTFEGSEAILAKARETAHPENIEYVSGQINETLPRLLDSVPHIDFALVDATHTYEATIQYFEAIMKKSGSKTIIAVADIHWSREMERAWDEIKSDPRVRISIDFYECGILILDPKQTKAHYILAY